MKTLQCYGNIATRRISDSSGSAMTIPPLVQGDSLRVKMRLIDEIDGSFVEIKPAVRSLKASFGTIQAPPANGSFKLKVGSGAAGGKILFNQDAAKVGQIISALAGLGSYGTVLDAQSFGTSCWVLRFNYSGEIPLAVADNSLNPVCDIRIRAFQRNNIWYHEIKLIQLPIAFTSTFSRILGLDPSTTIRRIVAGATTTIDGVDVLTNEVQAFTLDPSFRGTYRVKIKGFASQYFSYSDDISTVQDSLNAMGVTGAVFTVTTPSLNQVYVEFGGTLSGSTQDLLTIEVGEYPPGDIQFDIDLQTEEAEEAFRTFGGVPIGVFFEVEIVVGEDGETTTDTPGHIITLFREAVVISPELNYKELDSISSIDWLNRIPKDYIPFTPDQIITGTQFYSQVVGNGSASSFVLTHNLHTRIGHVTVQQNTTNGGILAVDTTYTVAFNSDDQITIAFTSVPTTGQYLVIFSTAGPASAFQAHTHTEGQVLGLVDDLNTLRSRVTSLETYLPSVGGGVVGTGSTTQGMVINLGNAFELLHYRAPAGTTTPPAFSGDTGMDLTKLPARPIPYLLPAILTTSVSTALANPVGDPSSSAGDAFTAGADQILPGGGRIRSSKVKSGDLVGCDGRLYYPIEKGLAADSSYYAKAFNRILWQFGLNDVMFSVNAKLDVAFGIAFQLAMATTNAEWVVAIEKGTYSEATTPGTPDLNLGAVTWDTENPIVAQKVLLTPLYQTHSFGLRLKRTGNTTFTMDKMAYGFFSGATALAPATANFALRARLYKFDTSDDIQDAKGWLAYQIIAPTGGPASQATIT